MKELHMVPVMEWVLNTCFIIITPALRCHMLQQTAEVEMGRSEKMVLLQL